MQKSGLPPKESTYNTKDFHLPSQKPSYFQKYFVIECILLLLIFYNFYLVISSYPHLPDKIPMHFNSASLPDGWAPKTMTNLLISPLVSVLMYLGLTIGALLISKSKTPLKYINLPLPREKLQSLEEDKLEELRELVIKLLLFVKFVIILMFTFIDYSTIKVASGAWSRLKTQWMMGDIAIIFIGIIWFMVNCYRIVNKKAG